MGPGVREPHRPAGQAGHPVPQFFEHRHEARGWLSGPGGEDPGSVCRHRLAGRRHGGDPNRNQTGRRRGQPAMNLSGSKNRLVAITKELSKRWEETKNHWRDAKSQEFEQRYMTELFANVDKTINVMDKLNELLTKVRKDCE